ncbi:hypothetical protein [Acetivibrio clariflavus]|uniref:hypothetical protein n=1 Tax=Acetivibrio clariflavus TaxID=288965 RepID=UPI0004BA40C4|nr:hypothetical protein [Acetivibrio clariflavus]
MINKVDYIVSLVGKNPMPSFITILNYLEYNPGVFLVYTRKSEENIGTKKVAENIRDVLMNKDSKLTIELKECDKSDPGEIDKVVKSIVEFIKEDVSQNKKHEEEVILFLDYSSGTKAMSAIFYEQIVNLEDDIIRTVVSYVDDRIIKLYSKTKKVNSVKIEDVFKGKNISVEDIAKLHGYKISSNFRVIDENLGYIQGVENEKIIFENGNNEQKIKVNGVAFLPSRGNLVLCFDSKKKNYKEQKLELFENKYFTNKLGGDKSIFIYRANFRKSINNEDKDEIERYKKDLRNEIVRLYDYEMRNRCYLIDKEESFEKCIRDLSNNRQKGEE